MDRDVEPNKPSRRRNTNNEATRQSMSRVRFQPRKADPTYDVENAGRRLVVPVAQQQQRQHYEDEAGAGPNVTALNDPLPAVARSISANGGRR
jgi:hypothetical protein